MGMNVAVTSEHITHYEDNYYKIRVLIVNEETRIRRDYAFRSNAQLTKVDCVLCEDGEYLYMATDAAKKHLAELRGIKRSGTWYVRLIEWFKERRIKKIELKKFQKYTKDMRATKKKEAAQEFENLIKEVKAKRAKEENNAIGEKK